MQIILGVSLLAVFSLCIWIALRAANDPPRLADAVPTVAPTPNGSNELPPQARGAYNPAANSLAVIAVVAPLLTTVIGFYFGARTGAQGQQAADARAARAQEHAESVRTEAAAAAVDISHGTHIDDLRGKYPQLFGRTENR